MPVINAQITSNTDDTMEDVTLGGVFDQAFPNGQSGNLVVGRWRFVGTEGLNHAGLRFQLSVPQGETINEALLGLYCQGFEGTLSAMHFKIIAQAADTVGAWNGSESNNRTTFVVANATTAAVDVDPSSWPTNDWLYFDVTAIVQEIISRPGWASGNFLRFAIVDDGTSQPSADSEHVVKFRDFTGSSSNAATLDIDYGDAGGDQAKNGTDSFSFNETSSVDTGVASKSASEDFEFDESALALTEVTFEDYEFDESIILAVAHERSEDFGFSEGSSIHVAGEGSDADVGADEFFNPSESAALVVSISASETFSFGENGQSAKPAPPAQGGRRGGYLFLSRFN